LKNLWEAKTKSDVLERMQYICTRYPETKRWIDSKRRPWILSGLTLEQSKIPVEHWMYARKHTGISESSHFQDNNAVGRKQSLLAAVLKYASRLTHVKHMLTVL
jgi:hypothetical protein